MLPVVASFALQFDHEMTLANPVTWICGLLVLAAFSGVWFALSTGELGPPIRGARRVAITIFVLSGGLALAGILGVVTAAVLGLEA